MGEGIDDPIDRLRAQVWPFAVLLSVTIVGAVLWHNGEVTEVLTMVLGFAAGSVYLRGVAEATTGRDPLDG